MKRILNNHEDYGDYDRWVCRMHPGKHADDRVSSNEAKHDGRLRDNQKSEQHIAQRRRGLIRRIHGRR